MHENEMSLWFFLNEYRPEEGRFSGIDLLITLKNAGISGAMQFFFSGFHTGLYGGFTDLDSIGKIWIGLHKYACDIGGSTVFGDLIINSVNQKHKNSNSKNNIEKK